MTESQFVRQFTELTNKAETLPEGQKIKAIINLIAFQNTVTIHRAVGDESRSINQLTKKDGFTRSQLLDLLTTYLNLMLRQMFNTDRGVTPGQVVMFVDEFLKLEYLTVEDMIVFVNWIKAGKFGKIYGKIDISVLNEWLDVYLGERDVEYHSLRSKTQYQDFERKNSITGIKNYEKNIAEMFGENVKRDTLEQFNERNGVKATH